MLKNFFVGLFVVILLGASGFSIYTNYQQTTELMELRESNSNLADSVEELKSKVDDLEYATDSSSGQIMDDIESKLDELEQSIQDLDSRR